MPFARPGRQDEPQPLSRSSSSSWRPPASISYKRSKPEPPLPDLAPVGANLIEGLGNYSMPVTAKNADVQRWFDQGLAMTYGFNHDAAERSFLKAAELDPDCAMCWWGAALVLGPHVNADGPAEQRQGLGPAAARAATRRTTPPTRNRPSSRRSSARYAENPPEDRRPLDEAYAEAMGKLAAKYPDDLDVQSLHAESLMDLQPWDYWDADGQPKGHTAEVVSQLESVMARNPKHAGALHLTCTRSRPRRTRRRASRRRTRCASCCRAPDIWCTCRRTSMRASGAITTR